MSKAVIAKTLAKVSLFSELEISELETLAKLFEKEDINIDTILFEEGASRTHFYIIESGEVEMLRKTPAGRSVRLVTFRDYDFLGEGCLLEDNPHTTTAQVLEKTSLLMAPKDKLLSLINEAPTLFIKILKKVNKAILARTENRASFGDTGSRYLQGQIRTEHDFLGERDLAAEHYYGIQTLRALENFSITGVPLRHYPRLVTALAMVKQACVRANLELHLIEPKIAKAIDLACQDILDGKLHQHFVVDMIQGGAGTSTNMNANEVIANRALEILGYERGDYYHCHPNNHINLSQSTNDVYPTSLKLTMLAYHDVLLKDLLNLIESFNKKSIEFQNIVKMGRTQLQDAVPMTLGQSFTSYSQQLSDELDSLNLAKNSFYKINLGGTAIGTGINADPSYSALACRHLSEISGYDLVLAKNLIASTQDTGSFMEYSNAIRRLAVKLSRVCNDLRLLSSGPRAGFNEINLPEMQPGSSIMPGKVNPVIPEVVNQIAFKIVGNDFCVTMASEAGQLELNVMEPVIAQSMLESFEMLISGMSTLRKRCIDGIKANEDVCSDYVKKSIGIVTALVPILGYETCSSLAKEAQKTGKGIYELILEKKLLPENELEEILSPKRMLNPVALKQVY